LRGSRPEKTKKNDYDSQVCWLWVLGNLKMLEQDIDLLNLFARVRPTRTEKLEMLDREDGRGVTTIGFVAPSTGNYEK
jgi:hypothetical protein